MKKPRSDSKLANLPEETQAEIAAWCKEGLEVGRDLLASKRGISISVSALSLWYAWYRRQEQLTSGNARVLQTLEWSRKNQPDAPASEIRNATFLTLSLIHEGDKDFQLQLLKEQGRDLDRTLNARKVAMQEARTKAASAVQEAGKRLEVTPDVLKEILSAVDRKLMGEA